MCLRQGVVLILILLLRGGLELLVVEHMHSKLGYVCVLYNIIDKKKHFRFKKKITFDFTFDMFLIFLWVDNENNI